MGNAGRVKHHISNNIENPDNTILIVGYCSPNTPGGILKSGASTIKLFGEEKQIRAQIETMDSFLPMVIEKRCIIILKIRKTPLKSYFWSMANTKPAAFSSLFARKGFHQIEIPAENQVVELN